jgi:hypothetical protein
LADLTAAASAALTVATKADRTAGTMEVHSAEQKADNSVGMTVFQWVGSTVANSADWMVVGSADQ